MIRPDQKRIDSYVRYHSDSSLAKDIDPANDCLRYVADRFELNTEQRYWLAFVYASCYSATTTYFVYNEFPDFETLDRGRMEMWWKANREKVIFQTDRRWTRSRNQWVDCVESYRSLVFPNGSQSVTFDRLGGATPEATYLNAWKYFSEVFTFGRFTMFLFLEMVNTLTNTNMEPPDLDLSNAESSRNGLAYALGFDSLVTDKRDSKLTQQQIEGLNRSTKFLKKLLLSSGAGNVNYWSIETTLCAFKKYMKGQRYVGYYIERSRVEIEKMSAMITEGVAWDVLWQFREETYQPEYLKEKR